VWHHAEKIDEEIRKVIVEVSEVDDQIMTWNTIRCVVIQGPGKGAKAAIREELSIELSALQHAIGAR
jgi:hypothetical protein